MGSLAHPLLVLGFALGGVVYAGIAYWLGHCALRVWREIVRHTDARRTRSEAFEDDRRVARMHPVGEAERAMRRAA